MDPYDMERTQAVWKRVMGSEAVAELKQGLKDMMEAEFASEQAYWKMAGQNKIHAPILRRMALEERQHGMKLSALYNLLYGQPPKRQRNPDKPKHSFREAVRHSFRGELTAAETYEEAAQTWRAHRAFFQQLARDEWRHSQNLRRLAQHPTFNE